MESLFSDFKGSTAEDWKKQLTKDLKGEAWENLIWQNENGFDINPYYTSEDNKSVYEPAFSHSDWDICVHSALTNEELNKYLLKSLEGGATSISINGSQNDLKKALEGIQLEYIRSTFFTRTDGCNEIKNFLAGNYQLDKMNASVFANDLQAESDLEKWFTSTTSFNAHKGISTVCVNALPFHNQAASAYHEVAIVFSILTELLEYCSVHNIMFSSKIVIKTGVNSDYFIQIAKLRAIRRLWEIFKNEYQIQNELHLIVETGTANKSFSDAYNNLLRTTVESMAAVAGGCNELVVNPFDTILQQQNPVSSRLAVNQQLILKHESYLDKMADISCGSFYIEHITDKLAEKALDKFKEMEKAGGYFKCLSEQIIANEINEQAAKKREAFKKLELIGIGVNKFRNEKEKPELDNDVLEHLKSQSYSNAFLNFELENILK